MSLLRSCPLIQCAHFLAAWMVLVFALWPQFAIGQTNAVLHDKTLVVWVSPANLTQRGGSPLSLSDAQSRFDAIAFGEIQPGKWMSGSDSFNRTQRDQGRYGVESVGSNSLVQIAITYRERVVTLFRNGLQYAQYTTISSPQDFDSDAVVLFGLRHLENGDRFAGSIDDARIYDRALTREQVAALRPNAASGPQPWAWWTFDNEECLDRAGRFGEVRLFSGARVENGRLWLDGRAACMVAAQNTTRLQSAASGNLPSFAKAILPADIDATRRLRNHLLADPYRPTFHFVMPEGDGFPFDPNGAIYWRGRYHLFYIYTELGKCCYGHVSSVDLVHWRQHPPALYPTLGSVDRGMFSGNCFINKRGEATMLYHGVDAGNSIATSTDELLDKWERLPSNPIIPNRRPNDPYDSWDPHGWVEGNTYYAIFGGQANPWPATLFKATELDRWRYVGKFFHHEMPDVAANEDTGCPDFFKMGNKWVFLCISHGRGARYYVGDWKNEQFHPEIHERMSWNDPLVFAPETLLGPDGRRIMWAWIHDCRNHATRAPSGWFGEMSLPRELSLRPDNRLNIRPVRELERLRYNERTWPNGTIAAGSDTKWDGLSGNTLELLIEIEPGNAKRFGLKVCRSPDGAEETVITYDVGKQKLEVDLSKSSREDHVKKNEAAPLTLNPREPLSLRVFIDKSVLEVFANDRQAVVRRMYPTRPDSTGISIFTEDASIRIRQIKSWQMAPSNAW